MPNPRGIRIREYRAFAVCLTIVFALTVRTAWRGMDWESFATNFVLVVIGAIITGKIVVEDTPLTKGPKDPPDLVGEEESPPSNGNVKDSKLKEHSFFRSALLVMFLILTSIAILGTIRATRRFFYPNIQITNVPPLGKGGVEQMGEICGTVSVVDTRAYRVVVFAQANMWYVEPDTNQPLTGIHLDGSWCNSIYLGHTYAALLVKPGYKPPATSQALPQIGDDVVASAIAEGH